MRSTYLLVIAGLALVLALWLLRDPRPTTPSRTPVAHDVRHRPPAGNIGGVPPRAAAPPASAGTATLAGQVVDGAGAPLPGATVVAIAEDDDEGGETRTAADGTWAFADLGAGRYQVSASHAGYGPVTIVVDHDGDRARDDVTLRLEPGARVDGDVVGPDGAAAAGATVLARCGDESARATTGADGRYVLDDLPRGQCEVSARRDGDVSPERVLELAAGQRASAHLALALTSIRGLVVDGDGRPVAGAEISAVSVDHDVEPRVVVVTADAHGRFALGPVAAGGYKLWARWPGAPTEVGIAGPAQTTAARGAREVRLTLAAPGTIVGTVRLDGRPARGYHLRLSPREGGIALTDEPVDVPTGRFTRSEVPPGDWRVAIDGDGLIPRAVDVTVRPGQTTDLGTLDLQPGVTVRGQVLGSDGAPAARALVSLVADQPEDGRAVTQRIAAVDEAGGFVLPAIAIPRAALVLELWAGLGEGQQVALASVTLAAGQTTLPPVTLRLGPRPVSRP